MADTVNQITLTEAVIYVIIGLVAWKLLKMLMPGSFEGFSAATPQLAHYQSLMPKHGKVDVATLTSPGAGISGHSLLSVGYAQRSVGDSHYGLSVKVGLPLADGGPVRFVYTEPSRYLNGHYSVALENESGQQMPVPGSVMRLSDGSSRLQYFNDTTPAKYAAYNKIVVIHTREDGKQTVVLEGAFS